MTEPIKHLLRALGKSQDWSGTYIGDCMEAVEDLLPALDALAAENARLLGLLPVFTSTDPVEQEMARHLTALYEWVITHRPGRHGITTPEEPR